MKTAPPRTPRAIFRLPWKGVRDLIYRCLLGGASFAAQAQSPVAGANDGAPELTLDELVNIRIDSVFAASKHEQKVTLAPASVSIVTADEIQKFGYRTLADVLRGTRGFYVANDRSSNFVGSRGFQRAGDYNTRYLFLIDGHRMNDNIYDAGAVGTDGTLDVDLIDRVEIIRGPSSSIYGNSAFLGVVSITTKKGHQINGLEGSVEAGSFETYKGRFTAGKRFANGVDWLFSGSYFTSAGKDSLYYPEFDQRRSTNYRARNNGFATNADAEEGYQFFSSLTYRDFTLTGLYKSHLQGVPTAPYGSFFGSDAARISDERAYVELKYSHEFSEDTAVLARASYDVIRTRAKFPFDYGGANRPADLATNYNLSSGDWLTAEVQVKQRVMTKHLLMLGAEYRENLAQEQQNYDSEGTVFLNTHHRGRSVGAYVQAEAALAKGLTLNGGLRYDHFDTFGGILNPRIGVIYSPVEKTTFKLLYGHAYRAPNDYEITYGGGVLGQAAQGLRPETIRTYELIYEQYLPAHLRLSASGFYYEIEDLITQAAAFGGGDRFQNLQRVQSKGLEVELEGKYPSGVLARASYTMQQTKDAETGFELSNSPRHLLKGNLSVPLYKDKVFAGLEFQYQSGIHTASGARMQDFFTGNFTLFSRELVPGLEMSAGVYNLLDTKYGSPASADYLQDSIPENGRNFRFKLTYKF